VSTGWGVVEVLVSPFPEKNIHFYIQNDKFGCIFDAVFNWQKTWTVLEALGHEFYGSIAKRSLQKQVKIIHKFSQIKEGVVTTSPPPPNTPLYGIA